jgi:hypothetical protein
LGFVDLLGGNSARGFRRTLRAASPAQAFEYPLPTPWSRCSDEMTRLSMTDSTPPVLRANPTARARA